MTDPVDETPAVRPSAPDEAAAVSPRLSFQGWLFRIWLAKNKGFIKAVLAPCSAVLTGGAIDPSMLKPAAIAGGIGLLTIVFKIGWDALDYFVSAVQNDPKEPRS